MMENALEAIRGCTRDCFENCAEKGVIYGVGLSKLGDAGKNQKIMDEACNMGKNI